MIAFTTEESIGNKGYYKISLTMETCKYINCCLKGSYNTVFSRLFGLSYANFMRMARDEYSATLLGKKGGYIICIFKDKKDCDSLVKELNRRWNNCIK